MLQLDDVNDATGDATPVKIGLALGTEMHGACGLCVEGMVYTDADILACHDGSTALAYDYLANADRLTVCALNAEVLRI